MQQNSIGNDMFRGEYLVTLPENWENWRTKSLNSGSLQRYSLPINQKSSPDPSNKKSGSNDPKNMRQSPKIIKINDNIFCILLNNKLTLFSYLDESQRERKKVTSRFIKIIIDDNRLPYDIQWVFGDGSDRIYVASEKQVVVLSVKGVSGKEVGEITEVFRKQISNIKAIKTMESNLRKYLIILTKQSLVLFNVNKNYQLITDLPINFSTESSGWQDLSKINGISLVASSLNTFYFFGTSIQLKADVRNKLGRESEAKNQPVKQSCEALYLTKIEINSKKAQARVFIIDHIFEIGIFAKSKVHQVGNETFLLSLYEEIIVIRRNFSKFMVWDNVSIVSSKNSEKKGQLVLADKRIMVYTENSQISAYELFFNFEKAKLETPKIDSFRGNGNQQQILYEAIILEYKKSTYMKVLFYFKETQIQIPNKNNGNIKQSRFQSATKNDLSFQIMCIEQTEPTEKLKEYLQKNKKQEIQPFIKRFHIDQLTLQKSEWEVSAKGLKEIVQLLLKIKDNQYIQTQLTKILISKPHDLLFLIAVQKNQIQRYRTMIATKLLLYQQHQNQLSINLSLEQNVIVSKLSEIFLLRELDEVKLAIQWLLQSKMFQKKLLYSLSFMSFKQYDFIDIGKLRAASLREEIKLLGVKGYQKRLKYFFNSFKYLVLDDFKEIIKFVIADLGEYELQNFFSKSFPFILPSYEQPKGDDRCNLWDDTFEKDELEIETIGLFCEQIQKKMSQLAASTPQMFLRIPLGRAIQAFNELFAQFRSSAWFIQNSYKQHSLLHHSIEQLKSLFSQLKQVEVFNMIIEFAYEKIEQNRYDQKKVKDVITNLSKEKYFTEDYLFNIQARLEVYDFIVMKAKIDRKRYMGLELPPRSKFIIMKESELFQFLFENFTQNLVNIIRGTYQTKKKGLFLQNLNKFLYSPLPKLEKLIDFMANFRDQENAEVRKEFFQCICKMLPITDNRNSTNLIDIIKNMPVFTKAPKQKLNVHKLADEAKVCYANYFSPLFIRFNLNYTHAQLLAETECTSLPQTKILSELVRKFSQEYSSKRTGNEDIVQFKKSDIIDDPISNIDLHEMIDFLSLMLYFHHVMEYGFESVCVFNSVVVGFLEVGAFQHVGELIEEILEFGKLFDDRELIDKFGNYRVFNQFKIQTNIKKQFQTCLMDWINTKYQWLVSLKYRPSPSHEEAPNQNRVNQTEYLTQQILKKTFYLISSILKILNFYSTNEKVEAQISRVSLFSTIKQISPNLLSILLPTLILDKDHYKSMSSFAFMMSILHKISDPSQGGDPSNSSTGVREIFTVTRRQQILQLLSGLNKIQKQYINVFQAGKKKSDDMILGQLCRFNVEFVVQLMKWGYPRIAGFVLLDLINSSYYYRDVLFYYLARMADPKKVSKKTLSKLVYQFITIDSPHDLKKILNAFIVDYQLSQLAPVASISDNIKHIYSEILGNNQLDEAFFFTMRNIEVQVTQFEDMALSLNKFREDHVLAQGLIISFIRAVKQRVENQNWPTFMLYKRKVNCMMRPLEKMEVIKDIVIMLGQLEIEELRKKVKEMEATRPFNEKDKQAKFILSEPKNPQLSTNFMKLKKQYERYMKLENLNPWLTINTEQIELTAIRLEKYPDYTADERKSKDQYYKALPIIREEETAEVKELRKKLFENQQKLKQIQETNRQLMEEQIVPAITQVKLNAEREHLSLIQRKKKKKQEEQKEKEKQSDKEKQRSKRSSKQQKEKSENKQDKSDVQNEENQLMKLDKQEKEKVDQLKKNYSSKIIQETQNLINQLRQRRRKVKEETAVTFASEDQNKKVEQIVPKPGKLGINRLERSQIGSSGDFGYQGLSPLSPSKQKSRGGQIDTRKSMINNARDELKQRLDILRDSHLKTTAINRLMSDKNGQFYVPRWEPKNPMRLQFEEMLQEKPKKQSQFLQKMKKQMVEQNEKQKKQKAEKEKAKKITVQDLVKKYKQLNQPYAEEMIQKISVVLNNPKACTQIIKNLYLQMKEIRNFVELCKDLLLYSESTKEFLEQKSIKIVEQSMKTKVTISVKEIFPPHFFTSIHSSSLRDYYPMAYRIIQPNLLKLMQQPTQNVNSLAMMIRFGFGSDPSFYYKVYEDYIQSLLQGYESKSSLVFVEKDLMQLAQKIRTNYNNLNPVNKKIKFEQLVQSVKAAEKRKALIRALLINLENKSTMVNKQAYEDFRVVLVKLEDAL